MPCIGRWVVALNNPESALHHEEDVASENPLKSMPENTRLTYPAHVLMRMTTEIDGN
jgi:hypothetical protein